MGTDAYEKSTSRTSRSNNFNASARTKFRSILIFVAGICVWSQAQSYISLKGFGLEASDAEAETPSRTRGLKLKLTDVDRDWIDGEEEIVPHPQDTAARQEEEAHALEKQKLKAEAEKAKAQAEMAKLEAEKLKLEVAQAKLDADRAKQQAAAAEKAQQEATDKVKEAEVKAGLQEKIAAKHKARADRAEFHREQTARKEYEEKKRLEEQAEVASQRAEEQAEAAKAVEAAKQREAEQKKADRDALNAKIAAKQAARAEKEAEKGRNLKKAEEDQKREEEEEQEEEQLKKADEEEKKAEEEEKKAEEEEQKAEEAARLERVHQKQAEKEALDAKRAAKQAARAEKEAEEEQKKEEEEQNNAEEAAKLEEETPKKTEEEQKKADREALNAKIAAKQAARAEQEAKKAEEEKQTAPKKETKLVVPIGPPLFDTSIRQWGCARNETPFVFVHIGKAGGGGVRSRMAASALEYNRSDWFRTQEDPSYYYPVHDKEGNLHKAKFESSKHTNWVPKNLPEHERDFSYEGYTPCAATTPLGGALSCSLPSPYCKDHDGDKTSDNRCDLVYVGHNVLGSELHWLSTEYLVDWWKNTKWGSRKGDFVKYLLADRFNGGGGDFGKWEDVLHKKARRLMNYNLPYSVCPPGPLKHRQVKQNYDKCTAPKEPWMDNVTKFATGSDPVAFGAEVIASMPVMRVTVMREPFSWLTSKFFWHPIHYLRDDKTVSPDGGERMMNKQIEKHKKEGLAPPNFIKCDDIDQAVDGWASFRALSYIFYLCGEHCMGGWAKGTMTIEDMERQAAYNLRNSFAVVGLLEKTDEFYDMVTKRVYYMDTSLNPEVKGKKHGSGSHAEAMRCKEVYKDPDFKSKMMARSPALAALYRLYQIAIEVNEFQGKELAECSA